MTGLNSNKGPITHYQHLSSVRFIDLLACVVTANYTLQLINRNQSTLCKLNDQLLLIQHSGS